MSKSRNIALNIVLFNSIMVHFMIHNLSHHLPKVSLVENPLPKVSLVKNPLPKVSLVEIFMSVKNTLRINQCMYGQIIFVTDLHTYLLVISLSLYKLDIAIPEVQQRGLCNRMIQEILHNSQTNIYINVHQNQLKIWK